MNKLPKGWFLLCCIGLLGLIFSKFFDKKDKENA